jgi:hypothetical protein
LLETSGQDRSLPLAQSSFAYMHCEFGQVNAEAVALFALSRLEDTLYAELR